MVYIVRYTRSTNHIEGIPERSTGPATDNSATTGVVGYYATSACPSLSRSGHKMGVTGEEHTHLAVALEVARVAGGRKLCKNCERAALRTLENGEPAPAAPAPAAPARTYADAIRGLAAGTDVSIYTTDDRTIMGTIAGSGTLGVIVKDTASADRRRITVAYTAIESFEHFVRDADGDGDWVDPLAALEAEPEAPASAAAAHGAHCPVKWATGEPCEGCRGRAADDAAAAPAASVDITDLPAGTDVRIHVISGKTITGSLDAHEHDTDPISVKTARGPRHIIALASIESFEYFVHDDDGGQWIGPTTTDLDGSPEPMSPADAAAAAERRYDLAEREYRYAADRAERLPDDAGVDEAFDVAWEAYAEAAQAIGRCDVLGCEKDAEPGDAQCLTHIREHGRAIDYTEEHDARTCPHRANDEPCTACSLLAMDLEDARVAYRKAVDDSDGSHDRIALALADAALTKYQAAGKAAAACLRYECTAVVDDGMWCPEHGPKTHPNLLECRERFTHDAIGYPCTRTGEHDVHESYSGLQWRAGRVRPVHCPAERCGTCDALGSDILALEAEQAAAAAEREARVAASVAVLGGPEECTARLDYTEPGKAIALIMSGHRFESAPQAWLSYAGGSWLLVDDYDGQTFNVKGPDAERAVRAWAVLRGTSIDNLMTSVEYGGDGEVFEVDGVTVQSYTYDGPDA